MPTLLTQLSDEITRLTGAAAPSIVRIDGARRSSLSGLAWSGDLVVTAAHAIRARDGISIAGEDGRSFAATLAGADSGTDVALLRVTGASLQPVSRSAGDPRAGHLVLVAGRPGRSLRTLLGTVTAAGGEWQTFDGSRIDRFIDVDASLPRGFSGGALLDSGGALIGMNTSRLTHGGTTVPHETLERVVDELLQHGSVRRPMLGIGVYPVEAGLLVMSVRNGSSAATAGMLVGDIVTKIENSDVRSPGTLQNALNSATIGKEIDLELTRGGQSRTIRPTVGQTEARGPRPEA